MKFNHFTDALFSSCLHTFGEKVQYEPKRGLKRTVDAIFVKDYELIKDNGADSTVSTSVPVIDIEANSLDQPPMNGDLVWVRDTKYRVSEVQSNGEGQIKLILKKVVDSEQTQ